MKKLFKRLLAVICCICLFGTMTACSGQNKKDAHGPGEYTFVEAAMGGAFEVNWTLTLKEDGSFTLVESNPVMGDITYSGTEYTVEGDTLTTGPLSGGTPLAGFFNEDLSCEWTFGEGNTVTPVNYDPDAKVEIDPSQMMPGADGQPSSGGTALPENVELKQDIPYASNSDSQKLDLYLPEGQTDVPVIVMIHGGAFQFGSKDMDAITDCLGVTQSGYAVASIDYRLSNEALFPGAVADAKAAVRFLRAHADEYGIDGDKIAVWGQSAGAYIANMVALTPEVEELNGDVTDNGEISSEVSALISWFAPLDFYNMDAQFEALGVDESKRAMGVTGSDSSAESKFIGKNVMEDEAFTQTTNPEHYLDQLPEGYDLYAYYQHGDADVNVPCTQSEHMAKVLGSILGEDHVKFELLSGQAHEGDGFYASENLDKITEFLDSIYK